MAAEDTCTSYRYINASGNKVDLAFDDEHTIAQVCHYVMLHCVELISIGNPNKKNIVALKRASGNLLNATTMP
jgi:hypothetical protein